MRRSPSSRRHLTTPEPDERTVSPASFYKTNSIAGSSHTKYIPPSNPRVQETKHHEISPLKRNITNDDIPRFSDDLANANSSVWQDYVINSSSAQSPLYLLPSNVAIDGRDEMEEHGWWDPVVRQEQQRPGAGLLPSALVQQLIRTIGEHLYFVLLIEEELRNLATCPPHDSTQSTSSPTVPSTVDFSPPSSEELMAIKPHIDALYSPDTNSWTVIQFKSGPLPPSSFDFNLQPHALVDENRRSRPPDSCLNSANLSHHYHTYPKLLSRKFLDPPLQDNPLMQQEELGTLQDAVDTALDVYACCQCSSYIVVSEPIPGVLPMDLLRQIYQDKMEHPSLGMSGPQSVVSSLELLLKAVENCIWKGERRPLSMTGKAFQKLGANSTVLGIFSRLRYSIDTSERAVINPPDLDGLSATAQVNRAWLLRSWLELSCFLSHLKMQYTSVVPPISFNRLIPITLQDTYIAIRSILYSRGTQEIEALPSDWYPYTPLKGLGVNHEQFTADLLEFAYRAQCRCDPGGSPSYLQHIIDIKSTLPSSYSRLDLALGSLIAVERSRGRWSLAQIETSAHALGFGRDHDLKLEWSSEIEDEFLVSAWKDAMRRAWDDPSTSKQRRIELTLAATVLAEQRGSRTVVQELRSANPDMDPEQAFRVLEVPKDVEEDILLMVYQFRVEERPQQLERMRQALMTIAEYKNSPRLHTFLETGIDGGERAGTPHPADWPRGLNQLGNTCYLNSLLQYFYTIVDLRNAIKAINSNPTEKLSSDALAQVRVGGRLISKREVERSRQFTVQLASLFHELETSVDPAVTPSLELAKLALVTSKDEDDDTNVNKNGTDSSNSTDATLVEEASATIPPEQLTLDTRTVLGKRERIEQSNDHPMKLAIIDASKLGDTPMPPPLPPRKKQNKTESVMMFGRQHDVAECMDNCLFQIEAALLKTDEKADIDQESRVVKTLFYGKSRQRITPVEQVLKQSSSCHNKEDAFSHLSINVSESKIDLYDGLSEYFSDMVEFEGKPAKMEVELLELPPILQIQLQRVKFDRKSGQAFKSQVYIKFEEILVMDRFMEKIDPVKKATTRSLQNEIRLCRERIRSLEAGEHGSYMKHMDSAISFLGNLPPEYSDGDMASSLLDEREQLRSTLQALGERMTRSKVQLEELWSQDARMIYELSSVFVHRGSSPSWGHYFFYTRHLPDKPNYWFKMNDSQVTAVSKEEVLADTTDSTANAYLLVYARRGSGVIQTVSRDSSKMKFS